MTLSFVQTALAQLSASENRVDAFAALELKTSPRVEPLEAIEANDVEPQLINGIPVDSRDFPAILRMTTGGTCTASLVGPASILLAAHCVGHFERIAFVSGETAVAGICEHGPEYDRVTNPSIDLALCLMERELTGVAYETVDIENRPSVGDLVVLTGYGCTFRGGPLDGLLRIGVSDVQPAPSFLSEEPGTIYTPSTIERDEAVLCPGDSGGPLFRTGQDLAASRQIVGVNSQTTFEAAVPYLCCCLAGVDGFEEDEDGCEFDD